MKSYMLILAVAAVIALSSCTKTQETGKPNDSTSNPSPIFTPVSPTTLITPPTAASGPIVITLQAKGNNAYVWFSDTVGTAILSPTAIVTNTTNANTTTLVNGQGTLLQSDPTAPTTYNIAVYQKGATSFAATVCSPPVPSIGGYANVYFMNSINGGNLNAATVSIVDAAMLVPQAPPPAKAHP
jgi:hypothetical protein